MPPNAAFRERSRFLACKQGKKDSHDYVQELRVLVARMASDPLPEAVKATVFMEGLRPGPAKTQLFRMNPSSLEDAMEVAIHEDYCHKQAHASVSAVATPMEVNSADNMRCFQCGSVGHMKRDCPRRFKTSGTRGRRYGKQKPPRRTGNVRRQ